MIDKQPDALQIAQELEAGAFAPNVLQNERALREIAASALRMLHAELSAIGAGGVEPLRKCLHQIEEPASLAASAGSEPVAWRVRRHDAPNYWIIFLHRPVDALADPEREVQPLYLHPSPPEGMVGGWQDIATAPEGQMVVVGWLDHEDTEHPERHDFDLLEDGCWQQWHEHAEHVEIIGGHGVSYTPPYTVWMPVSSIPTTSAGSKGE